MTFKRFINRNRLAEGGYDHEPAKIEVLVARSVDEMDAERQLVVYKALAKSAHERLDAERNARNMLLGDLRRLEADAMDERSTCAYIAHRTGVDSDTVAAVLKEFISW